MQHSMPRGMVAHGVHANSAYTWSCMVCTRKVCSAHTSTWVHAAFSLGWVPCPNANTPLEVPLQYPIGDAGILAHPSLRGSVQRSGDGALPACPP